MKSAISVNILVIIGISTFLAFLNNSLSKNGLDLIRVENELSYAADASINESDQTEIYALSLENTFEKFDEGTAIFIDARDNWDFKDGHIKGAINIPEFSFDPLDEKITSLDKSSNYVIYCSSNDCDISKRLASELKEIGFTSLFIFLGGYEIWNQNGYPVEIGSADE